MILHAVVFLIKNVSGHAKVRHLHRVRLIQPEGGTVSLSSLDLPILARGQNLVALTGVRFLHAVARSEISVDKLLGCQILHPLGDLQPESDEILYGRVLKKIKIKIQQRKYVTH